MNNDPIRVLQHLKPSAALEAFFDARFGVTPDEQARFVQRGFWHVTPFAHAEIWAGSSSSWLGVRLIPDCALHDMPVVAASGCGAVTISPTLRNLVPNWILHLVIEPGAWQSVQTGWTDVEPELRELHASLGGDEALFERFKAYALNPDHFQTPAYLDERTRAQEFLQVDESTETRTYREWLAMLIADDTALPPLPTELRAWDDAARCALGARAYALHAAGRVNLVDATSAMWQSFTRVQPFDSARLLLDPIRQFHTYRNPTLPLFDLASALTQSVPNDARLPDEMTNHPLWAAALALGRGDSPSSYRGVEHIEAAARLDLEVHDGNASYDALVGGSFWSAANLGFPYQQAYDAALHLARQYDWAELQALLEANGFRLQTV